MKKKKGAKERFDRALRTIFQVPKTGKPVEKQPKDAASQPKRGDKG
jgi:hypothetical protein